MNLAVWDWLIITCLFLIVGFTAAYAKRYVNSVADFIAANRCGGRYLLVGSEMMAAVSAAWFISYFEQFYESGFPILWWTSLITLVTLVKSLSGWVQYRFRETRCLTMAQFFEIRYSKNFRIFTGMLAWLSGIFNFAIHPAITARFIVYFCGLPVTLNVFGFQIKTILIVMFIMLSVGVILARIGQIALMLTDWLQGQLMVIATLILAAYMFWKFGWTQISETLQAAPAEKSMLNPFNQSQVSGFNIWFFLMFAFLQFYHEMAFQGNQGFFGAAKSPHEAKMARILGTWRPVTTTLLCFTAAIVTYTVFHNQNHVALANTIQNALGQMSDEQMRVQMRTPLTLAQILPAGLMGILASVFIASSLATENTYMHAWGTIFIQDVLMPLRKKRLEPQQHLRILRLSVLFVAVFVLIAGSLIPIRDYIAMYFQITFAVYGAGAGAVIIGGLYWKKGTTAGAWSAMIFGAILCLSGFTLQVIWNNIPVFSQISSKCPFNGFHVSFVACLISVFLYVVVSLLNRKEPFDTQKMLHRGKYSLIDEHKTTIQRVSIFQKLFGVDKEFTYVDKITAYLATIWVLGWITALVLGGLYYFCFGISDSSWASWWLVVIIIYFVVGAITFIWYFIGGVRDIRNLFQGLKTLKRNEFDDGTVVEHHSLNDEMQQSPMFSSKAISTKHSQESHTSET